VAISRAMYFQAKLVILDEPTTALAVSGVQKVLTFIERLKKEKIASIFVTHNLHHVYSVYSYLEEKIWHRNEKQ